MSIELFGLQLHEPMSMLTDGMLFLFGIYAFNNLKQLESQVHTYWSVFFLVLGCSTLAGIFGHLFFHYWGYFGKYPSWFLGILANGVAGIAMLKLYTDANTKAYNHQLIWLKSGVLLLFAIAYDSFLFVVFDSVITYLFYIGLNSFFLFQRGAKTLIWMVYGVALLIPTVYIFINNINPSNWFNKNDLSHVFMLGTLICFYIGIKGWSPNVKEATENV